MPAPPRRPIDSTVIAALDYSAEHACLEVTFHTGRIYDYFLVPPSVFTALREAESVGRYFNQHIRNEYRCVEVTGKKRKGAKRKA
ncbi:MAG TPA: KTSC domain-containing protein [Thermoanaerobaculia bacterium]|nr:KTSC domain-containing protein [Thermoanaerobaculia bacterium]